MRALTWVAATIVAGLAAPAFAAGEAGSAPVVKWRVQSSFPKSLDTIHGGAEHVARRVAEITDGRFHIAVFAAGEIVPPFQVLDAVQNGTVEAGHTASYYYFGKDPTFAFGTAVPFGLNARQQNAWLYQGGGLELMRELYATHNVIQFPAGNTGAQMGGWFRREIHGLADLKGLKFRIAGLGGVVLARLGAVPQQIGGPDIYPALEKGTIDAAEWVGPYDDEKLGFHKVAPHYYYPGFWEGGPTLDFIVNKQAWEALPRAYQAALEAAAAESNLRMLAKYDALNTAAIKRLIAAGVQLHAYPPEVMRAAYIEATKYYEETSVTNPRFRKVYESMRAFRNEVVPWHSLAEGRFDAFMQATMRAAQREKP
ncbi:MAG TPA: TRAP transporter substrate-binding protein [Verrucomicrobiae bacterium]|nr:TRAP transporter substrate-binding protein [Verrucomicrobiae bacterium]